MENVSQTDSVGFGAHPHPRRRGIAICPIVAVVTFLLLTLSTVSRGAEPATDFQLPDLDGKIHQLSDFRGRWVLVNYWATWCPPCLEEIPELEVFHNSSDGRALVLGVNMEDIEMDRLRAFVEEQFISYPILIAGSRPDDTLGAIPGLPTSFLVDPEGRLVARQVGPVTADAIRSFIDRHERSE